MAGTSAVNNQLVTVIRYHNMLNQSDADGTQHIVYVARDLQITAGRNRNAAGMVVGIFLETEVCTSDGNSAGMIVRIS